MVTGGKRGTEQEADTSAECGHIPFRFDLSALAGSFGDYGTIIPLSWLWSSERIST
jgi:hypothetical protein